jgi:lysozyme family protein
MYSPIYAQFVRPWLTVEGGYVNDPADRGCVTNLGITLPTLQALPDGDRDGHRDGDIDRDGDVDADDIRALRVEHQVRILYDYFWAPNRCEDLPPVVALCLFDGLLNHRPGPAKRLVQQGLGVPADGRIGPMTIAAAERCDPAQFLPEYCSYRSEFYATLVRADASQARFARGWYRRLFLLQHYLLTHPHPLPVIGGAS